MPTHMTVGNLISILESLVNNGNVPREFAVSVWVPDGSGSEAMDLFHGVPDIDFNEQMVCFKLDQA